MKKVLIAVLLALTAVGMAFAADVGHTGGVIEPGIENTPPAVTEAVGGKPFETGTTPAPVPSTTQEKLQEKHGTSVVILNIPSMTADAPGVFVFGINIPNMKGKSLSLFFFYLDRGTVSSGASAMSISDKGYEYRDENGRKIDTVPDNGKVFVAANVSKAGTYNPVIAVQSEKGGSGGGCDAGFSFAGLLSLGALFLLKKGK